MMRAWLVIAVVLGFGTLPVGNAWTAPHGNGVSITDQNRAEFEPYGKITGSAGDEPGYTGHVEDAATSLSYVQQRHYDAAVARFLSVDPVAADGNSGGNFNRYWYGNNNPYLFVDPDGRQGRVAWLVKLGTNQLRKVARLTKEQAVAARRAGENVVGDRRQVSHEIETAAHGSEAQLKHAGHELADGSKGLPHYQTEGVTGHSFWGTISAATISFAGALDQAAEAVDSVEPVSVMTHIPQAGQPGIVHECATGCSNLPDPASKPKGPPKDDERGSQ